MKSYCGGRVSHLSSLQWPFVMVIAHVGQCHAMKGYKWEQIFSKTDQASFDDIISAIWKLKSFYVPVFTNVLSLNSNRRALSNSTGKSCSTPSKEKLVQRYNQYFVILIGWSFHKAFSRGKIQFWACESIVQLFFFKFIMLV